MDEVRLGVGGLLEALRERAVFRLSRRRLRNSQESNREGLSVQREQLVQRHRGMTSFDPAQHRLWRGE